MLHDPIKTYSTASFRQAYIQPEAPQKPLLQPGFEQFFIVRVEDMMRQMKLPVPPTRTDASSLVFLTDGEAVMDIGSETYTIGPHECLVVPAGQVFAFASGVDQNRGYLCNFRPDFLVGPPAAGNRPPEFEFLRVWGNPRIRLTTETAGFVQQLMDRMLQDHAGHALAHAALQQAYLVALLREISQDYRPVAAGPAAGAHLANRFRELLFAHFKTQQLVADYAAQLCVSPNHLNKVVKAATGKSPTTWIAEAVVLEAKVLLHQSALSVGEVAAEVGLTDASSFSRLFKKHEGLTPLEFRRRIEKSGNRPHPS
ncbi:AraC family transcriptional regulator [Hymenobacter monticola]|uniref:Helix-turn-helix transcriptional regulator n=1 Tax=Hymenobacter monticola TaxID=1705399 RepID=A0ABY4B525_9BACT|nr:helix-turn-helix domain-containing protein [Hymenobacter monticola]UOE34110.1 helix-turn-helix transcriptional regulator [Hymenobacter monticola]